MKTRQTAPRGSDRSASVRCISCGYVIAKLKAKEAPCSAGDEGASTRDLTCENCGSRQSLITRTVSRRRRS